MTPQSLHDHAFERGSTSGLAILRDLANGGDGLVTNNPHEEPAKNVRENLARILQSTTLGRNKKPNPLDDVNGPPPDMPLTPGAHVRLLKRPDIFRHGSKQKSFTDEVFTVLKRSRFNPNAYYLRDDQGTRIHGKLYRRQLQELTNRPDRWEVRIIKRRTRRGRKEVQVEWVGFANLGREWIPESDLSGRL
jgi:hypothetical protein